MNKKLVTFFLPPLYGNGLSRVIINLLKPMINSGFKVDLVVPRITGYHQSIEKSLPAGVRSISLDLQSSSTLFIGKIFKLSDYLKQEKPAVLMAHGDYIGVANLAKLVSRQQPKVLHGIHINISRYFDQFPGTGTKLKYLLLKYFYTASDGLVAVSKGVAEDLSEITGIPLKQIQVIYNPVVTIDLLNKAKQPIDHPWFMTGEPPVILGAGRLMIQKDYPTLIRAFAKVRQHRLCRLMIIGEITPHKVELEALAAELGVAQDVQMPGFANNPYAYMSKAAVFVMSSQYEGFGNVLVEAMATGTPVVSTDCESGPAEILGYGQYGKLAPVGDAEGLAAVINDTLDRPLDTKTLQARAQDFVDEKIARQYLEFIEKLIANNSCDHPDYAKVR